MAFHRNDEKATAMYELYKEGHSLEKVASAFGCSRQSIYAVFKRRGFTLRSRPEPLPFVIFNGGKYTLRNNGYYGRTDGGRTLLHRDMWEKEHGMIPQNFDVHHKDHDKTHNRIDNFELQPKDDHARLYPSRKNQNTQRTHCHRGHEFTPKNTYTWNGHRICRACSADRMRTKRST
jgi:hypothetical protein